MTSEKSNSNNHNHHRFTFAIDRGGTFTDIYCELPDKTSIVRKLLSVDPNNYDDAPREGIRRILCEFGPRFYSEDEALYESLRQNSEMKVPTKHIARITMGTTVATNALLERQGARCALLITKGFGNLLKINNQTRSNIFDLEIARLQSLYEEVVEVDERVILAKYCRPNESPYKNSDEFKTTSDTATKEEFIVLKPLDERAVRDVLVDLKRKGITSIAVALMHSYSFRQHEVEVGKIAKDVGIEEISLASDVSPMTKIVPRGHTALASAYLTPIIQNYVKSFLGGFTKFDQTTRLNFMKSDGGLADVRAFGGHQAILSGPAGGVIGYAKTSYTGEDPVIGFDMGGTSTDVSRFDGSLELLYNSVIADTYIQAPQLDISTVAAGGGSRLFLSNGLFIVGPESAGSDPGPVCYRKNGHLAVTDANLVLGRIVPDYFPRIFGPNENEPLDYDSAYKKFEELRQSTPEGKKYSIPELAAGFIRVANEAMCRPIRNLTTMKGHDLSKHILSVFGGAGPQHACAIAMILGMKKVLVHKYGGILSAYGLSMADVVVEEQEAAANIFSRYDSSEEKFTTDSSLDVEAKFGYLENRAIESLTSQGYDRSEIQLERYLHLRFEGTDTSMMTPYSVDQASNWFVNQYKREFGFVLKRDILLDDYRVRGVVLGARVEEDDVTLCDRDVTQPQPERTHKLYVSSKNVFEDVPVYRLDDLEWGHTISGPCILIQNITTIIVEENCIASITKYGNITIDVCPSDKAYDEKTNEGDLSCDPIKLSIYAHRFMGIAECMGRTLARTSTSGEIF